MTIELFSHRAGGFYCRIRRAGGPLRYTTRHLSERGALDEAADIAVGFRKGFDSKPRMLF